MTIDRKTAAQAGALAAALLAVAGAAQAADGCDALTARMIRATGASLAGRQGSLAVFRAADAARMSLDCRPPRRMVLGSSERAPLGPYFTLIGLAAQALTGAAADEAEALARILHQTSLLAGAPRQGVAGRAAIRCQAGPPREDGFFGAVTVCVLAPSRPPGPRSRAGLSARLEAG